MQSSTSITKISAALVKAQSEMTNAKKDSVNPFFKKAYANLNSIREAVLPVLNKNGITAIQPTCILDGVDYVETVLLHESGEYISSLTRVVVDKVNDAQRHGSGLSYARRYALQSIVNIGAEDDDANSAVGNMVNHVQPMQPALKAITAKPFGEAIGRIAAGELDLIAKIRSMFALTDAQDAELKKYEKD